MNRSFLFAFLMFIGIIEVYAQCNTCYGRGVLTRIETCTYCQGEGSFTETVTKDCPKCYGRGYKSEHCSTCSGRGVVPSSETCPGCNGKRTTHSERINEYLTRSVPCATCDGKGVVPSSKSCHNCNGSGEKSVQCYNCQNGKIHEERTRNCNSCRGNGEKEVKFTCPTCKGERTYPFIETKRS